MLILVYQRIYLWKDRAVVYSTFLVCSILKFEVLISCSLTVIVLEFKTLDRRRWGGAMFSRALSSREPVLGPTRCSLRWVRRSTWSWRRAKYWIDPLIKHRPKRHILIWPWEILVYSWGFHGTTNEFKWEMVGNIGNCPLCLTATSQNCGFQPGVLILSTPSGCQTWQWTMDYLSMIFLARNLHSARGFSSQPCLMKREGTSHQIPLNIKSPYKQSKTLYMFGAHPMKPPCFHMIFPWFSHGFPLFSSGFLWFSHGFPMVFPSFSTRFLAIPNPLLHPPGAHVLGRRPLPLRRGRQDRHRRGGL